MLNLSINRMQLAIGGLGGQTRPQPTFVLPFQDLGAGEVSLVPDRGGVSATFTRATTATTVNSSGLIASVSSGVARSYYDPTSLSYLGYLAEGARTNLLLRSEDTTNASWTKVDTTPTLSGTGPDGVTNSANLLTEGTAGTATVGQSVTISAGAAITVSMWAKRGNTDWMRVKVSSNSGANGFNAWFNLATGAAGARSIAGTGTTTASSVTSYPNGWYRITASGTVDSAATAVFTETQSASADSSGTRVNNSTRLQWGMQFEAGAFASSYIPTTNATVTRNADLLTYPTSGWYVNAEGTFVVNSGGTADASLGTFPTTMTVSDGTGDNRLTLYNGRMFAVVSGSASQADFGTASAAASRVALAYKANDFSTCANGGVIATDTSGAVPVGVNLLDVGNLLGTVPYFGAISRTSYYATRLPDGVLQQITA